MLFFDGAFGLIVFGLWVFCVIDVIVTPESDVRNLPKIVWLVVVILLFDIGAVLWLIAGHNWTGQTSGPRLPRPRAAARFGVADRPTRSVPANPDDDEAFLRQVRDRAEQQRQQAKLRREQEERDQHEGS